jgi:hypothetical protein
MEHVVEPLVAADGTKRLLLQVLIDWQHIGFVLTRKKQYRTGGLSIIGGVDGRRVLHRQSIDLGIWR